jgi:glycosyltransferase involved in cell wall biosynthesis
MHHGKDKAPLVSIALATYNGERFLAEQLDSLLRQTYPNLEIVISDDGSTDGTRSIIARYAATHPRISTYVNSGEKGVRNNFQYAIRQCKGDLIALCDQDDIWLPGKIEELVNQIGDASLIYHDSLLINEEAVSLETRAVPNHYTGNNPVVFLFKNVVSGHACLFKREILREALPFPAGICHDWWLAAVAADQRGIKFYPKVLVYYRQHGNNASDFLGVKLLNNKKTAREIHEVELTRFEGFKRLKRYAAFFNEWHLLNKSKTGRWLCFRLFYLSIKNRKSLFLLYNKGRFSVFFRCLGFLWGLKLKRVVDKKYYFEDSAVLNDRSTMHSVRQRLADDSSFSHATSKETFADVRFTVD